MKKILALILLLAAPLIAYATFIVPCEQNMYLWPAPQAGSQWYTTCSGKMYYYNGSTFVALNGTPLPGSPTITPTPTVTVGNTPTPNATQIIPFFNPPNTSNFYNSGIIIDPNANNTLRQTQAENFGLSTTNSLYLYANVYGSTESDILLGSNMVFFTNSQAQEVFMDGSALDWDFSKEPNGIIGLNGLTLFGGGVFSAGPVTNAFPLTVYDQSPTPTPHVGYTGPVTVDPGITGTPIISHYVDGILIVSTPAP